MKDARGRKYFAEKELEKLYQKTRIATPARFKERITADRTARKTEPPFQEGRILIYRDDFLTTNCIRKGSIDLIVASPPYNVGIKYNTHDDTISYQEYLSFTEAWLTKGFHPLKEDGRFCLNISPVRR
jgi:DNA modification methylase